MAKGNDGNLLQHGVELAAVSAITNHSLHLTCTHSMAPRESCPAPSRNRRLCHWLNSGLGFPSVVAAYRRNEASLDRYPNTAELVASIIGDDNISGDLFEVSENKVTKLLARWSETDLHVHGNSWRQGLSKVKPPAPETSWLFTMDPMTFLPDTEGPVDDDAMLRPNDVSLLIKYFQNVGVVGPKWVISIFCFELRSGPVNYYDLFLSEMRRMSNGLSLGMASFQVTYGNPHVAAVFSPSEDVIEQIGREWQVLHNV
jgi:hypothetical protein